MVLLLLYHEKFKGANHYSSYLFEAFMHIHHFYANTYYFNSQSTIIYLQRCFVSFISGPMILYYLHFMKQSISIGISSQLSHM